MIVAVRKASPALGESCIRQGHVHYSTHDLRIILFESPRFVLSLPAKSITEYQINWQLLVRAFPKRLQRRVLDHRRRY